MVRGESQGEGEGMSEDLIKQAEGEGRKILTLVVITKSDRCHPNSLMTLLKHRQDQNECQYSILQRKP